MIVYSTRIRTDRNASPSDTWGLHVARERLTQWTRLPDAIEASTPAIAVLLGATSAVVTGAASVGLVFAASAVLMGAASAASIRGVVGNLRANENGGGRDQR